MRADRPSSTAQLIAASTVFLARDPRTAALVPEGAAAFCERFLRETPSFFRRLPRWMDHGLFRALAQIADRATIPGMMAHYMVRKRSIEQAVVQALDEGARQVVVIGAGLDTLALRLAPAHPAVRFLEIDHPATQSVKRAALKDTGPANLAFAAADLGKVALDKALRDSGAFDPALPSVFVAEGLLMYLSERDIRAMFATLGTYGGGFNRFVFTFMEPTPGGRIAFHNATFLVSGILHAWSEPFTWGISRALLPGFLRESGYELVALRGYPEFAMENSITLAQGETVCMARGLG